MISRYYTELWDIVESDNPRARAKGFVTMIDANRERCTNSDEYVSLRYFALTLSGDLDVDDTSWYPSGFVVPEMYHELGKKVLEKAHELGFFTDETRAKDSG